MIPVIYFRVSLIKKNGWVLLVPQSRQTQKNSNYNPPAKNSQIWGDNLAFFGRNKLETSKIFGASPTQSWLDGTPIQRTVWLCTPSWNFDFSAEKGLEKGLEKGTPRIELRGDIAQLVSLTINSPGHHKQVSAAAILKRTDGIVHIAELVLKVNTPAFSLGLTEMERMLFQSKDEECTERMHCCLMDRMKAGVWKSGTCLDVGSMKLMVLVSYLGLVCGGKRSLKVRELGEDWKVEVSTNSIKELENIKDIFSFAT